MDIQNLTNEDNIIKTIVDINNQLSYIKSFYDKSNKNVSKENEIDNIQQSIQELTRYY